MTPQQRFKLPVGQFVRTTTGLVIAFMIAMPVLLYVVLPIIEPAIFVLVLATEALVLLGSFAFAPLSVSLQPGELWVHYPLHKRRYDIAGANIQAIDHHSIWPYMRTMGNGGLFAFTGHFRNKTLGKFRYHSREHREGTLFTLKDGTKVVIGLAFAGLGSRPLSGQLL